MKHHVHKFPIGDCQFPSIVEELKSITALARLAVLSVLSAARRLVLLFHFSDYREPQREQTNIMACPLGANTVCAEDIELKSENNEMIIMYIFSFIDDFY